MSERKHTPTPWKYYTALGAECIYAGGPPRDNPQGIIAHMDKQGDAVNAAFIVKAVNSHDQLVEALKKAKDLVYELGASPLSLAAKYGPDYDPPTPENIVEMWEYIVGTLKAAGEEV